MVLSAGAEAVEPAQERRGPSGHHRYVHVILYDLYAYYYTVLFLGIISVLHIYE